MAAKKTKNNKKNADSEDRLSLLGILQGVFQGRIFLTLEFFKRYWLYIIAATVMMLMYISNKYVYQSDMAKLKEFVKEKGVDVFLVHHVRKQGDSRNRFNRFNGTKGIIGAADTMFLLDKENEYTDQATLSIKGRDLQYKELTIRFSDYKWDLVSEKTQEQLSQEHTPEILFRLIDFLRICRKWRGSATELLEELGEASVAPNVLTKYVNQYRMSLLIDEGIEYTYRRTHSEGRVLSFQICDDCDGRDGQEDNSR